jgi:hypothetical protein
MSRRGEWLVILFLGETVMRTLWMLVLLMRMRNWMDIIAGALNLSDPGTREGEMDEGRGKGAPEHGGAEKFTGQFQS